MLTYVFPNGNSIFIQDDRGNELHASVYEVYGRQEELNGRWLNIDVVVGNLGDIISYKEEFVKFLEERTGWNLKGIKFSNRFGWIRALGVNAYVEPEYYVPLGELIK